MSSSKRNFIIFSKHRRLTRLWQFFFTGWGLIMIASLVAGALFTKQLLWTPISAINLNEITANQFKMSGAEFAGYDKNGDPFTVRAAVGRQEYENPDVIFLETLSGTITHRTNGRVGTSRITSASGQYNRKNRTLTLYGNVHVDSDNGDKLITKELVIRL